MPRASLSRSATRRGAVSRPPTLLITIAVLMLAAGLILFYVIGMIGSPSPSSAADKGRPGGAPKPASPDLTPPAKQPTPPPSADSGPNPAAAVFAAIAARDAAAVRAALASKPDLSRPATEGPLAGLPVLVAAAQTGDSALVEMLLAAGASVDQAGPNERTSLHEAASIGSTAAIDAILRANAGIDARDASGRTALMLAVAAGHDAAAAALLAGGASVNAADDQGWTAIALAADGPATPSLLDRLLQAKADAAVVDKAGLSPLMKAAALGSTEKVLLLLNAGAPAGLKAPDGRTARDLALARNDDAGRAVAMILDQAVP